MKRILLIALSVLLFFSGVSVIKAEDKATVTITAQKVKGEFLGKVGYSVDSFTSELDYEITFEVEKGKNIRINYLPNDGYEVYKIVEIPYNSLSLDGSVYAWEDHHEYMVQFVSQDDASLITTSVTCVAKNPSNLPLYPENFIRTDVFQMRGGGGHDATRSDFEWEGYAKVGDNLSFAASSIEGFMFKGWYKQPKNTATSDIDESMKISDKIHFEINATKDDSNYRYLAYYEEGSSMTINAAMHMDYTDGEYSRISVEPRGSEQTTIGDYFVSTFKPVVGEEVTLSTYNYGDYYFSGWYKVDSLTEDLSNKEPVSTSQSYTFVTVADDAGKYFIAGFKKVNPENKYTVTIDTDGHGENIVIDNVQEGTELTKVIEKAIDEGKVKTKDGEQVLSNILVNSNQPEDYFLASYDLVIVSDVTVKEVWKNPIKTIEISLEIPSCGEEVFNNSLNSNIKLDNNVSYRVLNVIWHKNLDYSKITEDHDYEMSVHVVETMFKGTLKGDENMSIGIQLNEGVFTDETEVIVNGNSVSKYLLGGLYSGDPEAFNVSGKWLVSTRCSVLFDVLIKHSWGDGVVTTPATCEADGVKTYTCTCGETKTEAVDKLGHEYGEWTTVKDATCEEAGQEERVCSHDASHKETREVESIGHDWDEGTVLKEPTFETEGEMLFTCKHDSTHTRKETIPTITYNFTKGEGTTWNKESSISAQFIVKRSYQDELTYSQFDELLIDDEVVDPEKYTTGEGSLIINLKPEYLESLSLGDHIMTVKFTDGSSNVINFKIQPKQTPSVPKTGDNNNLNLYMVLMISSLIASCYVYSKKNRISV